MFDEEGVCSVCRQIEYKDEKIDWEERRKMLDNLITQYKDKGEYDCIIPFSGGKDSTFQLWFVVKELKIKPLVFRFDHWGYRPLVQERNNRTFKILGVDVLQFTPNWHVVRELMLESLKRRGDFCWHCHTGIYAHTMQIAIRYETPLIIWGESLAEYASWYSYDELEEVDERRFNKAMNLGMTADDMYEFLGGRVSKRDLYPFKFPQRKELLKIKCRSICLGNYIKWDMRKQVEIIKKELGWKPQPVEGVAPEYNYDKTECCFQGMRDYCRYIKRGYGRTAHLASVDVRNNRKTREEAWELAQKYDGKRPASIKWFLDILQITEKDFFEIIMKHQVDPWKFDPSKVETVDPLQDMDKWDRTQVDEPKVGLTKNNVSKTGTYI
jgi:N-acetyl sugar amidotransferase